MMEVYQPRSRWKIYLAAAGIVILLISLVYTSYLAKRLRDGERNKAILLFNAFKAIQESDLDADITLPTDIISSNLDIPIMVVSESGEVLYARNFSDEQDTNKIFLRAKLIQLKKKGPEPTVISDASTRQYLYYQNSKLHELLAYFPYIQLLLLGAFIAVGYVSVNNARRAEQNRVWVGMAKETAHQLGTPISAIIGWIEHLRDNYPEGSREVEALKQTQLEVLHEMQNDVDRLDLIADRFSKIGSAPDLTDVNVYDQMREITTYIQRRAPRKIVFEEPSLESPPIHIAINPPLFNWVIENIMRNALDAIEEGVGTISWKISNLEHFIEIDISDTGKGIPASDLKAVFEPGFTTKARGWGLGLSLAKRIIENYHKGKIFVKHSRLGEGTTFSILLPKRSKE
ncbi:MAG TPA: HAMP domain-containing sensor histidine kinase [Saprospiraceae bacterium]|nr:HAMP domain-containing sensor histidine kinase [Saprospiraceae bacterium]